MKISIIGMGYVGLPLALAVSRRYEVVGYDIDHQRIDELNNGYDKTLECSSEELTATEKLIFSSDEGTIADSNFYIVTVPTPIDHAFNPDLKPLQSASLMVGAALTVGDIVVYESTVYPGCTEEFCVPILEKKSGLKLNKDFYIGYSPERINPGDKEHTVTQIKKVVSGSNSFSAQKINDVYSSIIEAGTHLAPSVKVAEAAKVIENTQRDINIALMNELSVIFNELDIDTGAVLEAASTKWNFLNFTPGLVGGHCIGVDPYYLMYRSKIAGIHPELITAGRRINDGMSQQVVNRIVKQIIKQKILVDTVKVLMLGVTFKENCPDVRNSKVFDIIDGLTQLGLSVDAYDPLINNTDVSDKYTGLMLNNMPQTGKYNIVVMAVAHSEFKVLGKDQLSKIVAQNYFIFDLKNCLDNVESLKL